MFMKKCINKYLDTTCDCIFVLEHTVLIGLIYYIKHSSTLLQVELQNLNDPPPGRFYCHIITPKIVQLILLHIKIYLELVSIV